MVKTKYRSTTLIVQTILEGILRTHTKDVSFQRKGIVKSQLIKYSNLKTSIAEKYLLKMESAGYISSHEDYWGERKITIYQITPKGKERYHWFVKINTELE
ncbi:MAG: transcriptional regulator [Candidatus Hodarchaeales archaeon]|jgi:predicted transcriptional regulator